MGSSPLENINKRMARGAAWTVAARLTDRTIGVLSTVILARLLVPADFGLVAMATAIGAILELMGAFGFDLALIQNQRADRSHYDTAWTFNVIFGAFCALLMIALASLAARFYSEPRLAAVMIVLALSYLINGFGNIGVVDFRKELHFRDEFILLFSRRVVTFAITITGAIILRTYWALIIGMVTGRMVGVALSYRLHGYRPRFSLAAWHEMIHFSKWMLVNNFLFFLVHRGTDFVIGKLNGAGALGIYSVSYEISTLPTTELVAPINRVAFPGFSKLAEPAAIANAYLKIFGVIALLIFPTGIGIAAIAPPLVATLLGNKWLESIPLIQLLALYGAVSATQTNNGTVCLALGHVRLLTWMAVLFLAALLPALGFFTHIYGVLGAGYAFIFAQAINLPVSLVMLKRLIPFRWGELLRRSWRPLTGAAVMFWIVTQSVAIMGHAGWPVGLQLIAGAILGISIYILVVLLLWLLAGKPDGAEIYVLEQMEQMVSKYSTFFTTKKRKAE